MKKTSHFEKFLPKKKNSAIKEEFRQQKRKEKKARAEAIEQRKAAKRLELQAQRPPEEKRRGKGEGFRAKSQDLGNKTNGARTKTDTAGSKSAGPALKKADSRDKTPAARFKADTAASKPAGPGFKKADGRDKAPAARFKAENAGSKPAGRDLSSPGPASKRGVQGNKAVAVAPTAESASQKPKAISKKAKEEMPLNKYIAHCGVCSRRDAAELVKEGKIKVNGVVISEPGFKVTTDDEVLMSNKKIFLAHNLVYILLNKPKDYITTAEDPQGRKTVLELVRGATSERIFPIGRLDRNTTGVLLLTNDGELTQKLSHPSYEVRKMYEVRLDKPLAKTDFDKILKGVTLEDGPVQVDALAYADTKDKSVIGIELHSGRNRVVRRIFEALGYDVRNLDRVMFANLTKKNVERGKWRFLKDKEVRLLKFMNSSFIRKQKKSAV